MTGILYHIGIEPRLGTKRALILGAKPSPILGVLTLYQNATSMGSGIEVVNLDPVYPLLLGLDI